MTPPRHPPDFAALVRDFFCDRLVKQQNVSPHTVAAYQDTFRLLLAFLSDRLRRAPSELTFAELDAPTVLAFLDHLESKRGNAIRTRNARMTAVRAFVTYASTRDPAALPGTTSQVCVIRGWPTCGQGPQHRSAKLSTESLSTQHKVNLLPVGQHGTRLRTGRLPKNSRQSSTVVLACQLAGSINRAFPFKRFHVPGGVGEARRWLKKNEKQQLAGSLV